MKVLSLSHLNRGDSGSGENNNPPPVWTARLPVSALMFIPPYYNTIVHVIHPALYMVHSLRVYPVCIYGRDRAMNRLLVPGSPDGTGTPRYDPVYPYRTLSFCVSQVNSLVVGLLWSHRAFAVVITMFLLSGAIFRVVVQVIDAIASGNRFKICLKN